MRQAQPRIRSFALAGAISTLATTAYAADSEVVGTVAGMSSYSSLGGAPGNADLRFWLNGITAVCPGATDGAWAYINVSDADYKGVFGTVSLAYALGKPLDIVTRLTAIGNGNYCQVVRVSLAS